MPKCGHLGWHLISSFKFRIGFFSLILPCSSASISFCVSFFVSHNPSIFFCPYPPYTLCITVLILCCVTSLCFILAYICLAATVLHPGLDHSFVFAQNASLPFLPLLFPFLFLIQISLLPCNVTPVCVVSSQQARKQDITEWLCVYVCVSST